MDLRDQLQSTLGSAYTLERELGGGGMSRVFLARDAALDRAVVVKVLPPDAGAAISVERFKREISVAAKLQHPHIVPLLSAGDVGGLPYYTMPFVEGESLRARLAREGELPLGDAVSVLKEVARALAYAHERGIVHRDIKPDNVLLSGGSTMVTDFGIAKALSASATGGNTSLTQVGIALGSPAYMAPEQASADPNVDARADLYAFGCMAYELLSGQPPFTGRPAPALLLAHIGEAPESIGKRRPNTPPALAALVMQCLEKRAADRPKAASEVVRVLESVVVTRSGTASVAMGAIAALGRRRAELLRFAPWVLGAALVASASTWALTRRGTALHPPRMRFTITLGDSARYHQDLVSFGGMTIALSPDGSHLAFVGGNSPTRIYLRSFNELAPKPLPGTENATNLAFSADGKWLAFTLNSRLKKLPLSGGPVAAIVDSVASYWWDGDVVIFSHGGPLNDGLWRVSAAGGVAQPMVRPDSAHRGMFLYWPHLLPDGKAVLFAMIAPGGATWELAAARIGDGKIVPLGLPGVNPRYVSTGYLVFGRPDGSLLAAPFDPQRLRLAGPAVPVLENVSYKVWGVIDVALSENGTLAYLPRRGQERRLIVVDREGRSHSLREDLQVYGRPRYSPDGKRLALEISTSTNIDIWIQDLASGTLTSLTHDGRSSQPDWSSDGRRVTWLFDDGKGGEIRWQAWDGSGAVERLAASGSGAVMSPSGGFFVTNVGIGDNIDLVSVSLDSSRRRTALVRTMIGGGPKVSPDGRWLAHVAGVSGVSGRGDVYVQSIPGPGGVHRISTQGGDEPVWSPTGRELFYRAHGQLLVATLTTTPVFAVVRRDTLFGYPYVNSWGGPASYDVSRDGKRFVMLQSAAGDEQPVVVFGWLDELRERMALAVKK